MGNVGKQFGRPLGVPPLAIDAFVVETARFCSQPDLLQWFLQINDELTFIGERDGNHPANPLVINVGISFIVDSVARQL